MTTQAKPLLRGVEIEIGGNHYVVPPLNFRQVREHADDLAALGAVKNIDLKDFSLLERIARIVHAAISRNYPMVTIETIEDGLDLVNAAPAISAILGKSGFTQGEATALPASASQSTGTKSTAF